MNQLTAGLIVVIGILGGFYFGAKYGQGHPTVSATPVAATAAGAAARAGFGGAAGGGLGALTPAATGAITAVNGNIVTVMDRTTGRSVKVDVSAARISKTSQGTTADLSQSTVITVIGQTGSDGIVTAQTVAIGAGNLGGGGRQRQPSPAQS
jgi:hypothetical protein